MEKAKLVELHRLLSEYHEELASTPKTPREMGDTMERVNTLAWLGNSINQEILKEKE